MNNYFFSPWLGYGMYEYHFYISSRGVVYGARLVLSSVRIDVDSLSPHDILFFYQLVKVGHEKLSNFDGLMVNSHVI